MSPRQITRESGWRKVWARCALAFIGLGLCPPIASAWQCFYTEPFEQVAKGKPIVAHLRIVSRFEEFAGTKAADLPWGPGSAEVIQTFKGELPDEITLLNALWIDEEYVVALQPVEGPVSYLPRSAKPGQRSREFMRTLTAPPHTYSFGETFLSCEELYLPVRNGRVEGHVYMGPLNRVRSLFGLRRREEPQREVPLSRLESLGAR